MDSLIKIKKLAHFKGKPPRYESELASGFDVRACLDKAVVLKPGERALIPTGLSFEISAGLELQARPRSGLALKHGVTLLNTPGTIDADYRGEVKLIIINQGQEDFCIEDQMRIGQLVLCPVARGKLELDQALNETQRGGAGFGSTGL